MPSLEVYLAHAPECAQGIVNQWGQMFRAGMQWTPEFDAVFDLACKYIDAKSTVNTTNISKPSGILKASLTQRSQRRRRMKSVNSEHLSKRIKQLRKNRVRHKSRKGKSCDTPEAL